MVLKKVRNLKQTCQVYFIPLPMKSQIWNIYSPTSSVYAFKPIFDLSLAFLPRDQYNPS